MSDDQLVKFYERTYGPFVHMSEPEKAIWLRYLMQGGAKYAPFTYDLRVGNGLDMGATANSYEVNAALALTRKRIDVLFVSNNTTVIVEVKQRAGLGAIGQLIGYRDLLRRDRPDIVAMNMLLVTDQLQPDLSHLLVENGIRYHEVGV